jgi:hypothetical protein
VLLGLIEDTRAALARAAGEAAAQYAAALAELELEAVRRELSLPGEQRPEFVDRPEDHIPRLHLVLHAGSEDALLEVLTELTPEGLQAAWSAANAIPEAPLRLHRLTRLCLVLDHKVFGEEMAEARHRSYALMPYRIEERVQLVNDAIAGTFCLLRLRSG